jgi:membrane dipeptidase
MLSFMYDPQRWSSAIGGAKRDGLESPRASLEQLCNHIEHMVSVAGIDHVCIGSDYALGGICAGVETAAKLQNLARALTARGFRQADLNKILVANLERLLRTSLPA